MRLIFLGLLFITVFFSRNAVADNYCTNGLVCEDNIKAILKRKGVNLNANDNILISKSNEITLVSDNLNRTTYIIFTRDSLLCSHRTPREFGKLLIEKGTRTGAISSGNTIIDRVQPLSTSVHDTNCDIFYSFNPSTHSIQNILVNQGNSLEIQNIKTRNKSNIANIDRSSINHIREFSKIILEIDTAKNFFAADEKYLYFRDEGGVKAVEMRKANSVFEIEVSTINAAIDKWSTPKKTTVFQGRDATLQDDEDLEAFIIDSTLFVDNLRSFSVEFSKVFEGAG